MPTSIFHSGFLTKALYAYQLETKMNWHNQPTYDVTQPHPYNCLNTWSTRESDTEIWSTQMAYMFFFLQQFALHKIVLLTFKSIWHPMKQLLSGLHIKIPGYTGMSTLPPYHNLAQHTDNLHAAQFMICIFLQTLGTFFCKALHFIFWHLNLDIWRTVLHFHAKEMQVLKEESIILCLHFWKNSAIKLSEVTFNSIPSMFSKSYYVPLLSGTICFKTRTQQIITHISLNDERSMMSLENSLQLVAQTYQNINIIIIAKIPFAFLLTQKNCYYELFYVSSLF